jgi:hypothetical protein
METTLTLADIRRLQIAIAPHEAVAIAQQLMHHDTGNPAARPPFGPLSLDTVAIDADGSVVCTHTDATPAVAEVALVLQRLLGQTEARVPGGMRYAIGRALHEVEAPPFDSRSDFSEALERFERGDRRAAVASLYARAVEAAPDLLGQAHSGAAGGDRSHRDDCRRRSIDGRAAPRREPGARIAASSGGAPGSRSGARTDARAPVETGSAGEATEA